MQKCHSKVENFPCEECRNHENHCTLPVKLESKRQAKKVVVERMGGSKTSHQTLATLPFNLNEFVQAWRGRELVNTVKINFTINKINISSLM